MRWLKQSTAFTFRAGPFVDDTDGVTAETALTINQADIQISKDGGAFAQTSDTTPTTTHDADGWYQCPLTATDTGTLGPLTVQIAVTGALPVFEHFMVVPANVYDSIVDGADNLQVDATQIEGADATDQINAACDTALTDYDALVPADLPTNFADLSITATTGRVDVATIEGTDATDAINAEADTALSDFFTSAAQLVDDIWDETLTGATHNVSASAGRRLRELGAVSIRAETAQAGSSNSITLDAGASSTDEIYDNNLIVITAGTGAGQTRIIVEYNGTSKVATVDQVWEITPDATSEFQIVADQQLNITHHGIAQAGAAGSITLSTSASAQDDIYNDQLIVLRTSTGTGQARRITDYNGTTKVASVEPDWQVNPTSDSVYAVLPFARVDVGAIEGTDPTDQIRDAVVDDATRFSGADIASILTDTAEIGAAGAGLTEAGGTGDQLTAVPWNAAWDAEVESEATDALNAYDPPTNAEMEARTLVAANYATSSALATVDTNVDTLLTRITSTLFSGITSLAEWLGLIAGKQTGDTTARTEIRATGAGSGTYDETADSLEAIRDRGDAAWITGGGGGLTQSLNVQPVLPTSIDLANTATVRLGLILTNALDDLPSTAEITPGTISIERKAIGGTSWSAVVTDAAMSEQAGMVYYDEVFDSGTGYAEGDSIRVTFKSVSISADGNTHEVVGASGILFQTFVRETMRGTDGAYTGTPPTAAAIRTEMDSNSTQLAAIVADTNELQTDDVPGLIAALNDPSATAIRDAILDRVLSGNHDTAGTVGAVIQAILTDTGTTLDGKLDTIDTVVDAIKAKTDSLTFTKAGEVDANVQSLNDVTLTGTGTSGDEWGP